MNQNELKTRIERLEMQVFGMTLDALNKWQLQSSTSDYVIARIRFEIAQFNPDMPRYDYHVKLIQTRYGIDDYEWSHILNVIDAIKRGAKPDHLKEFEPRAE